MKVILFFISAEDLNLCLNYTSQRDFILSVSVVIPPVDFQTFHYLLCYVKDMLPTIQMSF